MTLDPQRRLDQLLAEAGLDVLQAEQNKQLIEFLSLLVRWNARTNLTAVRDPDSMLERHFVESIACAQLLPSGIATLLDYGSGAGFPGIPIAICRPEIAVTLAESQNKKAAFLREAVRSIRLSARVHADRAEAIGETFDCVTLRAVDRMERAVESAGQLVAPNGWLAPLTTRAALPEITAAAGPLFSWSECWSGSCSEYGSEYGPDPKPLPGSDQRVLALGRRRPS